MLADNINGIIQFVYKNYENKDSILFNRNKLYQIKLIMEDFKFQVLADELLRINKFDWDEKYTLYLVDRFKQGLDIIDEYVNRNSNDLFIISARLYTLKNLTLSFDKKEQL